MLPSPSSPLVRSSAAALAVGLCLAGLQLLLPQGGWGQRGLLAGVMAAAAMLLAVRLHRQELLRTRPWAYLAAGAGVHAIASGLWGLIPVLHRGPLPFPSPVDVAYFLSYGLYAAFLLGLLRRQSTDRRDAFRQVILGLIDAGILSCAAVALLWPMLIAPQLADPDLSGLALAAALAYPVMTAGLFGIATRLVICGAARNGAELLLGLWIGGELAASFLYGFLNVDGVGSPGGPSALGWLVSYGALGALALHPCLVRLTERRPRMASLTGWRLCLVLVAVLVPLGLGLFEDEDPALEVVGATGVVLVIMRLRFMSGDLAEQRRLADELAARTRDLEHQSLHDALTGVGNRRMLMERLGHALRQRPAAGGAGTGLMVLDLDGFKSVNDTLGHDTGDAALKEVAKRLSSAVRPADTVARLGGDEFAVVLEQIDAVQLARAAERVVEALGDISLDGQRLPLWTSVGVYLGRQGANPYACLKHADLAMYAAKERGGDDYRFFDVALRRSAQAQSRLDRQIGMAVDRGELRLLYQPIFDLRSDRGVGLEALLRWDHPDRGALAPGQFLEAADRSGAIVGMGRWVLQEACRQVARWRDAAPLPEGFHVAVNLSAREIHDSGLVDHLAAALDAAGIRAEQIMVETTGAALMSDMERLSGVLGDLKSLGVRIAMDDFGRGSAVLDRLLHLPVDLYKIDPSFVDRLGQDDEDLSLGNAMVRLATTLGKHTLAEGVELPIQLTRLRALEVDFAQGFLLGRPLPAADAIGALGPLPAGTVAR